MKILTLFFTLFISSTTFGQTKDEYFIGEWKAYNDTSARKDFQYLYLLKTETSYYGLGVTFDGIDKLAPFMLTDIKNWEHKKDTLILYSEPIPIDNEGNKKEMTIKFVIKEKGNNFFYAYYYDSEMENMIADSKEKFAPTVLKFIKQTK